MNPKDVSQLMKEIESTKPIRLQIKGSRGEAPRPIGFYNSKIAPCRYQQLTTSEDRTNNITQFSSIQRPLCKLHWL